ncbi:MAG: PcfJ domain-containing protein [Lachnospiraceae bacterium]|nr:PcfJ domain-containing protein [Lachnospiraceae bacterium]
MVLRYIEVWKEHWLGQAPGGKGPEIVGAGERLCLREAARAYFEQGERVQVDYHKHNGLSGEDHWDDCNLRGLNPIWVREAPVMPETYAAMEGTFLRYSALREYQEAVGEVDPFRYLEMYVRTPQAEMLVKLGLTEVVRELLRHNTGIVADPDARSLGGFLGIRKEKARYLMAHHGDTARLRLLQAEKHMGQSWTDGQVERLEEAGISPAHCRDALRHMTLQKLLNRVERYAGCAFGTGLSCCRRSLERAAQLYLDYLHLREQLGYGLADSVSQQPRDLREAHDRMLREADRREQGRRLERAREMYPLVREHYGRLSRQYAYQDAGLLIRPARSAEEIVEEGRALHHCVGGDHYLRGHESGEGIILMLRRTEDPEAPYITVEMARGFHIRQWHGADNGKPDEERVQAWLDAYVAMLGDGALAAGQDGTEAPLMVTA